MTSGGSRNRSGPTPAAGFSAQALPVDGYAGPIPDFPLPNRAVLRWEYEDKRRYQVVDDEATVARAEREAELWEWAWRTPQAAAWAAQPWRNQTVARWVRQAALCESAESTASDHAQLHRYADQVGLTTAGLREMGWKVAEPVALSSDSPKTSKPKRERRLRAV